MAVIKSQSDEKLKVFVKSRCIVKGKVFEPGTEVKDEEQASKILRSKKGTTDAELAAALRKKSAPKKD